MTQASLGLGTSSKRTRKREFLSEMEQVVPWSELVSLVAPYLPEGRRGRPLFPVESLLRIHFMQQWFTLNDPAMEEALHDVPLFRDFAGLGGWDDRLPDESTILRLRHVLERHQLAEQILATVNALLSHKGLLLRAGTVVDASLIGQKVNRPGNELTPGSWTLCSRLWDGVSQSVSQSVFQRAESFQAKLDALEHVCYVHNR